MNASEHPNDWFTMVCEQPHLLLWAKQKTYPYWPAKLMSVNSDKNTVDVRFFGGHSRSVLTPKDCLMFSRKNPSVNIGPNKQALEKDRQVRFLFCVQNFFYKNNSQGSHFRKKLASQFYKRRKSIVFLSNRKPKFTFTISLRNLVRSTMPKMTRRWMVKCWSVICMKQFQMRGKCWENSVFHRQFQSRCQHQWQHVENRSYHQAVPSNIVQRPF